jgi:hypothetical protein
LSGLNPEGVVTLPGTPWSTESELEVITDNGTSVFYGDDIPAKNLVTRNFKKSRSDRIALGAITKPVPIIVSVAQNESLLQVTWRSLRGETYRLQYVEDLASGFWQDVPGDVPANGPFTSKGVPASGRSGFYRVIIPGLVGF